MPRRCVDPEARRVALALLRRGLLWPSEAADMAGVATTVVEKWARRAGVDWRRIRRQRLAEAWRREIRGGPRLIEEAAPTGKRQTGRRGQGEGVTVRRRRARLEAGPAGGGGGAGDPQQRSPDTLDTVEPIAAEAPVAVPDEPVAAPWLDDGPWWP